MRARRRTLHRLEDLVDDHRRELRRVRAHITATAIIDRERADRLEDRVTLLEQHVRGLEERLDARRNPDT